MSKINVIVVIGIFVFMATASDSSSECISTGGRGGVVLSFDDHYVNEWYNFHNLVKESYPNWRATFFVSRFNILNNAQIEWLKELRDYGHEIGAHGYSHRNAQNHVRDFGIEDYLDKEIYELKQLMSDYDLDNITSFAYPHGSRNDYIDSVLLEEYIILRGITNSNTLLPEPYYNGTPMVGAISIDGLRGDHYGTGVWSYYTNFIKSAKEHDRIILFYGHKIGESMDTDQSVTTEISALLKLVEYIDSINTNMFRISDLPQLVSHSTPEIITVTLPDGVFGTVYAESLMVDGYVCISSVLSGALPDGLEISNSGVITGTPTQTGTFAFTVEVRNAAGADTAELSITVNPVAPTVTVWPTPTVITYGDALSASWLNGGSATGVGGAEVAGLFTWTDGGEEIVPAVENDGYSVTFTPDDDNYTPVVKNDLAVTVTPKPLLDATVDVSGTYIYTGAAHTPAIENVSVTLSGYTPTYSITSVTGNINAGTATVTVTGNGNFADTATGTFTILPKPLTADMLNIPTVTYNGTAQTPNLTAVDHDIGGLTRNIDYTVTLTPRTGIGIYPVAVTGIGNYTGTQSVDFVINPKTLTEEMLFMPSAVYNGALQIPVLTVIDHDIGVLTRNIDYTVTLTPRTEAGIYPVAVTGIGNYTGVSSVNFVIDYATALAVSDRVIPPVVSNGEAAVIPVNDVTGEFRVGPNPVSRLSGGRINFFTNGSGKLRIYNAVGNLIREVLASDGWDLKDGRGRLVPEGSYLIRGTITATDGKREKVSVMVRIR